MVDPARLFPAARAARALGGCLAALILAALILGVTLPAVSPSAAGAAAASCPAPDSPARQPVDEGDPTPGVTRIEFTFVKAPCRVLRTVVRYPTGATTPLPLILAVHGRDGDPTALRPLLDTWTAAGYVVAAPSFLVTDKDADDKPTGAAVARQAADARFVLDQLLELDDDPTAVLHDRIDAQHIGAAGMSLGGLTVYGLFSNTCCRDPWVKAAVLMAAVRRPFPHGKYLSPRIPTLLVQGDADPGYHNSRNAYPQLSAPKWFVTLKGAQHSPPFEIPRGREEVVVDATTTAFWNRYLRGDEAAAQQIVAAVAATHGKATLRRDAP